MSRHASIRHLALATCLAAAVALPAFALADDGDVRRLGQCSKSANSNIKLSPENGRIEVEFFVDPSRFGQTWRVILKRNRKVVVRSRATTNRTTGWFTFRRSLHNRRGAPDKVVGYAKGPTGEFCRAVAVLPA